MKILYIFPHPDDESFGPAPAISAQLRKGNEVHLLTLTKGEATKQRFKLGVNKSEMGEIRYNEMLCVEKVLGLTSMTVLDLPDNELKWMDPIELENRIEKEVHRLKPDIIITYAVHGISGFHDHLVSHAVVKRVYCKLRAEGTLYPRRLAFFTRMGEVFKDGKFRLEASTKMEIKVIETCTEEDMVKFKKALDCYVTYQKTIEESNVKDLTSDRVPFELFDEETSKIFDTITDGL